MFLRLVDAGDITALLGGKNAMDVLLQNLEIARHGAQRSPKLVTETSDALPLDAMRGCRALARGLLSFERDLERASALRRTRVQRPIQRVHALFGRTPHARIPEEPTDGPLSGARGSRLHGNQSPVGRLDRQCPFVQAAG